MGGPSCPSNHTVGKEELVLVDFFRHNLEEEDLEVLRDVVAGPILTTGEFTSEFERRFGEWIALPHVIALNSCTAALHLSLLAHDIGEGDEVITTPMTFVATALAVLHTGARPVFVDVEPDTGLIDPELVEKAITPRTKAVLPVHLYGNMADMVRLREIADRHSLKLIEDAAHCIEGERDGIRPGHLGDTVCYSFYATKNLACGEGGAVATKDDEIAKRIRLLSLHGMTKTAKERFGSTDKQWDLLEPGWKYNLDNLRASLLLRQLNRLETYWTQRKAIVERYQQTLQVPIPRSVGKSAYHLQTIWLPPERRQEIIQALHNQGVGSAINYQSVHELSYFAREMGHKAEDFPHAFRIGRSTLSLPLYPKLELEQVDRVVNILHQTVFS